MKLAIVHDYLNQFGGAERVVEVFHEIFPEAPIYTSFYIPESTFPSFKNADIRTSFMQRLPGINKYFKKYLLFYSRAFEQFDLRGYDVILSSSSAFAKGVRIPSGTCHFCYCYNPMRFVWDYENYIKEENLNKIFLKILPLIIKKLKKWDLRIVERVNYFIAISNVVKERIEKYYNRKAIVIYPPVETNKFKISVKKGDYFLVVSRLNPYKRIDLVIKAFNRLGLKLKVVGDGPYKNSLKKMSKSSNIEFLGYVQDKELIEIYSNCRAFILPGEEDFGIAPLEAQASGSPVIAYAGGGALETVIEGITGLFFREQSVESLIGTIEKFMQIEDRFNPETIRKNALRFDKEIYKKEIKSFIFQKYEEYVKGNYEGK